MKTCVCVYATPRSERWVPFIGSKLPTSPPAFYLRPLPVSGPWYRKNRVGVNMLKKFIPELCKGAGLSAHYTSHSLRAPAITRINVRESD